MPRKQNHADQPQLLVESPIEPPQPRGAPKQSAPTTAQQLGSLVKSARDIMRKDKGLNGKLKR